MRTVLKHWDITLSIIFFIVVAVIKSNGQVVKHGYSLYPNDTIKTEGHEYLTAKVYDQDLYYIGKYICTTNYKELVLIEEGVMDDDEVMYDSKHPDRVVEFDNEDCIFAFYEEYPKKVDTAAIYELWYEIWQ